MPKNRVDYNAVSAAIREGKSNADIRREIDGRLTDKTLNGIRVRLGVVDDMRTDDIAEAIVNMSYKVDESAANESEEEKDMANEEVRVNGTTEEPETAVNNETETGEEAGQTTRGVPEITRKSVYVAMDARGEKHSYTMDGEGVLTVFDADGMDMFSVPMGELKEIMREALWLESEVEKELARHE